MTLLTLLHPSEPIASEYVGTSANIVVLPYIQFDGSIIGEEFDGLLGGGWLPDEKHHKTARRREKIKLKRERRQDYVMRKIWNELKGITEPDEYLLALMAEFEGVEEVLLSPEQQQALLHKAYHDYVLLREERQAMQDKIDEIAIGLAISKLL